MAEGDGFIFDEYKYRSMRGDHSPLTDVLKIALLDSSYVPNIGSDTLFSGISGDECSGTGYTAGGETLANPSITKDSVNHRSLLDADDVTWSSLGALSPQPAYAVLYNSTTGTVIAYWEVTTLTNGGDYKLQFSDSPAALIIIT